MKGMDILCASEAATAICLSMDQPSSSSPSSNLLLGSASPAIDRYNPIIRDSRRCAATPLPPLTHTKKLPPKQKRHEKEIVKTKSWSCTKPGDFISPPGSTRYLLSEKVLLNALSDFHPPAETSKSITGDQNEPKPPSVDQVVVLRVSLHCRGCERKMRKHISRMEGVRSFNIDFAAKKVTVSGNVTPLEVLSSISKVKSAQLWGSSPTALDQTKGVADKDGSVVGAAS